MNRSAPFRSRILALALLGSICSVGLVALPAAASAAVAAPVCSVDDPGPHVVQHGDAADPVHFTCDNNGDGAIAVTVLAREDARGAALADGATGLVDYTASLDTDGLDAVMLQAQTANSDPSAPFEVDYDVENSAPECDPNVDLTVRAGGTTQLPLDMSAACSDPDLGDTLSYRAPADQSADHGTFATDSSGHGTYDLASSHFSSTSQFTDAFAVTVSDGDTSDDQTLMVNVTVTPDAAPVCTVAPADDDQTLPHGEHTITIPIACADAENDAFTVALAGRSASDPGVATLNGGATQISYEAKESGVGADTIDVHVVSTRDPSVTRDLLVHVTVTDAAPVCTNVALSVRNDGSTGGDLTCTDADGDALTFETGQAAAHGTVVRTGASFSYAPNAGFAGTDTFTILASDGAIETPITVTVAVSAAPVVTPPVVTPPALTPPAVTPPTVVATPPAPTLAGAVALKGRDLTFHLGCTSRSASCKAGVALSATLGGKLLSLGSKAVTLKHGAHGIVTLVLSKSARKRLSAFAGKTITMRLAVKSRNPRTGRTTTSTKQVKLHVPR